MGRDVDLKRGTHSLFQVTERCFTNQYIESKI